jgi:DNA-binding response OmpR family regulator
MVVEDDPTVAEVVARYLTREGFEVESISDGPTAVTRASATPPDLMVLDLMLPGLSGFEVLRTIRARAPVPVIMLTARGDEIDRVAGLELGADDYVAKPFSPRELTARVKSVLRRTAAGPDIRSDGSMEVLRFEDLEIDVPGREVHAGGRRVALTVREFDLLAFLAGHPQHVFRREQLLQEVWGYSFGDTSTVTVHVRRLREKIEGDPSDPRHVKTVWGVGYKFEP